MFVQLAAVCIIVYLCRRFNVLKKMFKPGSPLFSLGYHLHTKTSLGSFLHGRELTKTRQDFPDGHSVVEPTELEGVTIMPIPYLKDNYAYLVIDKTSRSAAVIDPGDADVVQRVIEQQDVQLAAVLTTHRHWDHSGGNHQLKSLHSDLAIYGSQEDRVPGSNHKISDGEIVQVGNLKFKALFTPGHTVGHTVYFLERSENKSPCSLFTGDIVFLGGNGRMFEGPPSQMLSSLEKICELPDDTLIWPGHEYALDDLQFARHIDPENEEVKKKLQWVEERRKDRKMTSPSTLGEEKTYNPFLRTSSDSILQKVDPGHQTVSDREELRARALTFLRKSKDAFSYKL